MRDVIGENLLSLIFIYLARSFVLTVHKLQEKFEILDLKKHLLK